MGVKDLWNILDRYELSQELPFDYLNGKNIAVDLSGWVVEAHLTNGLNKSKNPHLRNLFYRVSSLLKNGTVPIFVLEGKVPALKRNTVKDRNKNRHHKHSGDKVSRKYFDAVLLQCEALLKSLGVPCLKSSGEAEAYCAFLNFNKLVEGVVSEDSDTFLYGADVVFRNFTIERKNPHVKKYSLISEKNVLKLDRRKLVALALLLGCDYNKEGIQKIGKETATNLLYELRHCDILKRFHEWKTKSESDLFPGYKGSTVQKSTHCGKCSHIGSSSEHKKDGCTMCNNEVSCYEKDDKNPCICDWHQSLNVELNHKNELKVYKLVKNLVQFPNDEIIDEYLNYDDQLPTKTDLIRKCPNLKEFQKNAEKFLGWSPEESIKKCFPIITSWHLYHISECNTDCPLEHLVVPVKVLKKLKDGLKIEWKLTDTHKDFDIEPENLITIENALWFDKSYPEMSALFYSSQKNKNKLSNKKTSKSVEITQTSKVIENSVEQFPIIPLPSMNISNEATKDINDSFDIFQIPLHERIKLLSQGIIHLDLNCDSNKKENSMNLSSEVSSGSLKDINITNSKNCNLNIQSKSSLYYCKNESKDSIFYDNGQLSQEIRNLDSNCDAMINGNLSDRMVSREKSNAKFDGMCSKNSNINISNPLSPFENKNAVFPIYSKFHSSTPYRQSIESSLISHNSINRFNFDDSEDSFMEALNIEEKNGPLKIIDANISTLKTTLRLSSTVNAVPSFNYCDDADKSFLDALCNQDGKDISNSEKPVDRKGILMHTDILNSSYCKLSFNDSNDRLLEKLDGKTSTRNKTLNSISFGRDKQKYYFAPSHLEPHGFDTNVNLENVLLYSAKKYSDFSIKKDQDTLNSLEYEELNKFCLQSPVLRNEFCKTVSPKQFSDYNTLTKYSEMSRDVFSPLIFDSSADTSIS